MARSAVFYFVTLFFLGCSTPQKTVTESFDQASERFHHLINYESAECVVQVKYAEPVKSAWISQLTDSSKITQGSSSQVFARVEEREFSWQVTPYRCRIVAARSPVASGAVKEVGEDTVKKLETVMCIWLQSFYADSPVRGWRKGGGEPQETETTYRLQRAEGRFLEMSKDLKRVRADLAEGVSLSADYSEINGHLMPQTIDYIKSGQQSRLDQLIYEQKEGRTQLSSFWVNLADLAGRPASYFQVQIRDCLYH